MSDSIMRRKKLGTSNQMDKNKDTVKHHEVSKFLKANPDFFVSRAELLSQLNLPNLFGEDSDSILDFQLYQLKKRQGELDEPKNCAQDVIETSRRNMSAQTRTHASALALIQVTSLEQLVQVISDDFPLLLDIDAAMLGFEVSGEKTDLLEAIGVQKMEPGSINQLISPSSNAKLFSKLDNKLMKFFPTKKIISSAAVARLQVGTYPEPGVLILGSNNKQFHPKQGTELVVFLARVLQACILRFLVK